MPTRILGVVAAVSLLATASLAAQRSPFDGLRWKGETPEVQVESTWYALVAIDDVDAAELVRFAQATFGPRMWQKRIREDLVEVMKRMGHEPGEAVTLTVRTLDGGKRKRLEGVAMTREKRKRLWQAAAPGQGFLRVERRHGEADERFAFLATRQQDESRPRLRAAHACQDLDQLEWNVEQRYSYRDLRGLDYRAAFDTVRAGLGDGISRADFHVQLRKLVALFGDGHSRVRGVLRALVPGFAPCAFAPVGERIAAIDGDKPLIAGHPFVRAIDGRPIADWLAAAARLNARGAPQWERLNAANQLSFVVHLRAELGLPAGERIEFECESANGKRTKRRRVALARRPTFFRYAPAPKPAVPDDVGYLRIEKMTDDAAEIDRIHGAMRDAMAKRAMIIDVRGNGGGTRDILRALLPYFLDPKQGPRVVNVGAYRLAPGNPRTRPGGYLANRFLFPRDAASWTDGERGAIDRLAATFRPDWTPDPKRFSEWHYMVVSPDPARPHFEGAVALLIDAGCFSATDIFVGAFHGLPNVTLIGEPTGGGSGRARGVRLAHSKLQVRLSTMASFRPTGQRYDGVGIAPAVAAAYTLDDAVGRTDSILAAAVAHLRKR